MLFKTVAFGLALSRVALGQYTATWDPNNLPDKTEQDQTGTNRCGTGNNQTSLCQNVYINSIDDFCIWGPPQNNSVIGNIEQIVVSYCTKPGRGTRLIPDGTLRGAHFIVTPSYVQVTGHGDFTKIGIADGDAGGELDPHGPDGLGNPHGGLVFSNVFSGGTGLGQQIHEWTNFQSFDQFCIRACDPKNPRAPEFCQHIYDVLGCVWNIPSDYSDGFTSCKADDVIPMGLYPQPDGRTSTFHQGEPVTPPAHPPAPSSQCVNYTSADIYAALPGGASSATTSMPSGTGSAGASGGSGGSRGPSSTGATGSQTPAAGSRLVVGDFLGLQVAATAISIVGAVFLGGALLI